MKKHSDYVVIGPWLARIAMKFAIATFGDSKRSLILLEPIRPEYPNRAWLMPGENVIALVEAATRVESGIIGKPKAIIMDKAIEAA